MSRLRPDPQAQTTAADPPSCRGPGLRGGSKAAACPQATAGAKGCRWPPRLTEAPGCGRSAPYTAREPAGSDSLELRGGFLALSRCVHIGSDVRILPHEGLWGLTSVP